MKELTGVIQKGHIHHQAAGHTYNEGMRMIRQQEISLGSGVIRQNE